jgi:hypothetical protein
LQARPNPAALILPAYGAVSSSRAAAGLAAAAAAAPRAPILMHLFSGGGFLYSGLLLQALRRRGDLASLGPRIAGVILDSSPAFVTADVSARALLAAALREPAAGVEARHPRALGVLRGAVDAYLSLPVTRRRIADMEASWHALVPPCPKLYLYSESDVLVSPDTIQGHMQSEAVRGSRVYAHRWADSPHVEHYRLHPEEYTSVVARFLEEALSLASEGSREGSVDSGDWLQSEWSKRRAAGGSSSSLSSGGTTGPGGLVSSGSGGSEAGSGRRGGTLW